MKEFAGSTHPVYVEKHSVSQNALNTKWNHPQVPFPPRRDIFTKLISNARIVTFRIVTFFQKNPNGSKVRKSDIFSIFEQNMCHVLVVWGCRVLVVFFLSISGNGWLMNSTACIYAQKLKHFFTSWKLTYVMSLHAYNFRFRYQLPLFSYSRTFEADDAYVNGNA